MPYPRLELDQIRVYPLKERYSMTQIEEIVVDPDSPPPPPGDVGEIIKQTAVLIRSARERGASVMLTYGAHLLRNGMGPTLIRMMEEGWITHLATNGAGIIHDWEYSFLGRSTESVRENTPKGQFGTWDETGKNINLAAAIGAADDLGFGESIGRFIWKDGATLPLSEELAHAIRNNPWRKRTPALADLLQLMIRFDLPGGPYTIQHPWKKYSVPGNAYRLKVPFTVHPGIGYDIISNHPYFSPAAIGRGGGIDFQTFAASVTNLSSGVYISVGSAIMSPQVFEKAMSCANNVLLQKGKSVRDHAILIVDIQDGGGWDWTQGEPPKTNPAYFLRFCKSFYRMGGHLDYACADNRLVVHNLYAALKA
ncbi:MAG: hypothetical protein AB1656_27005 [Candidatus Omnitrophota bacterium]